jgi:hypothetical protein
MFHSTLAWLRDRHRMHGQAVRRFRDAGVTPLAMAPAGGRSAVTGKNGHANGFCVDGKRRCLIL